MKTPALVPPLLALALSLALAGCGASTAAAVTDVTASLAAAEAAIAAVHTLSAIAKGIADQVVLAHPSMAPAIAALEADIAELLAEANSAAAHGDAVDATLGNARLLIGNLETTVAPFFRAVPNGV